MVKDILKIVIALLIVFAMLAGLGYLFFGETFHQLKDAMVGMMNLQGITHGVTEGVTGVTHGVTEGVTDIFKH